MANWFYFNKNGKKIGPISTTALKVLAQQGVISRETVIINHTGRTAVAGTVNGLVFPESTLLDTAPKPIIAPPVSDDVYGLSTPEPRATPLAQPKPAVPPSGTDSPLNTALPAVKMPPAPVPVAENPFVGMPIAAPTPVASNPFVGKPVSPPFTTSVPGSNQTVPHRVPAQTLTQRSANPVMIVGIVVIIVLTSFLLLLVTGKIGRKPIPVTSTPTEQAEIIKTTEDEKPVAIPVSEPPPKQKEEPPVEPNPFIDESPSDEPNPFINESPSDEPNPFVIRYHLLRNVPS